MGQYWSSYVVIRFGFHPWAAWHIPSEFCFCQQFIPFGDSDESSVLCEGNEPMGVADAVTVQMLLCLLCVFNAALLGKQLVDLWQ